MHKKRIRGLIKFDKSVNRPEGNRNKETLMNEIKWNEMNGGSHINPIVNPKWIVTSFLGFFGLSKKNK